MSNGSVFADLAAIQTAIIEKDFAKAQNLSEEFLNQKPKEGVDQALDYWGLSSLYFENYLEARQIFGQVILQTKTRTLQDQANLGIIDSFILEGDYEKALAQAEKLVKLRPASEFQSLVYLKLARANMKLTNWTLATTYLNRLISEFPNSVESKLARQLLEEKQFFAVQIGAFMDRTRAEGLMDELKEKGEYSYIVETTDTEGKKFFRVRVGQLSSLSEAETLKIKLAQLGYPTRIYP